MPPKTQAFTDNEFDYRFDLYKERFGATFSYYLVKRSDDKNLVKRVYDLMQQALNDELEEPITDKMLGLELPPGILS